MEIVFDGEIILEDYLGEATPVPDDVSNGMKIKVTFHLNDPKTLDFAKRVQDRRERVPGAAGKFSMVGRFEFPDGEVRRVLIPDIYFGPIPIRANGRKEYVPVEVEGAAKRGKILK